MLTAGRIYTMLGNQSLWDTALASHTLLAAADVPHAVLGGVAVCLHGYQRNTIDIDMLVRPSDTAHIREVFSTSGWIWDEDRKQFTTASGVVLQFLLAGSKAGKASDLRLPDPAESNSVTVLEGLPVLTLAKLIESKLACGQGNARRMHKDFADVVELIAKHELQKSFGRKLHPSVRSIFPELVDRARDS